MSYVKYSLVLLLLTLGLQVVSTDDQVQVGRYSTMKPAPTEVQKDVFAAIVNTQFDETVGTVGEAMRQLLQNQGLRLAVPTADEDPMHTLIELPLPQVHQQLGPISLKDALETLAGPVWRLVQDPVRRWVSFELCFVEGNKEETSE